MFRVQKLSQSHRNQDSVAEEKGQIFGTQHGKLEQCACQLPTGIRMHAGLAGKVMRKLRIRFWNMMC